MKEGHFVAAVWVIVDQNGPIARGQEWRRVDEFKGVFTHAEDLAIETFRRVRFPWVNAKHSRCDVYVSVWEVAVDEDQIGESYLMTAIGHPMNENFTGQLDLGYLPAVA